MKNIQSLQEDDWMVVFSEDFFSSIKSKNFANSKIIF